MDLIPGDHLINLLETMGRKHQRVYETDLGNLISNLRGEIGEIIFSWVATSMLRSQAAKLRTPDLQRDLENRQLVTLDNLTERLEDDIISRLSELSEKKVGRLNFYFIQEKLGKFHKEVGEYSKFIVKNNLRKKRNYAISHKELPEKWTDHRFIEVPYKTLLRAIAMSHNLMRKIDREFLGPSAYYCWQEIRRKRYSPMSPPKVGYMLLPYFWPSADERWKIITQEIKEGRPVWEDMVVKINKVDTKIKTCGRWGALFIGKKPILLDFLSWI